MREIFINGRRIADDTVAWHISEIGHNHGGDVERCKAIIKAGVGAGVDAVKLQKRENKELYTKEMYNSSYVNENSHGNSYGAHREALEFGEGEYREIKRYCDELGVVMFATPFDFRSVDFLEKIGVPCYKIASGDLKNVLLQRYIAETGKVVMLSTGGGTYEDVRRAYEAIVKINRQLVIMQCTAAYPAEARDINLGVIAEYRRMFPEAVIGFSDHFIGKVFGPPAYVLGARVFEKHFTIHRWWKGTDQAFSLEPSDMWKYIRDIENIRVGMGNEKVMLECERGAMYKMGKKVVAARRMGIGEILTATDVRIVSPGDGMAPYEIERILGKKLVRDVEEEENLNWECIE